MDAKDILLAEIRSLLLLSPPCEKFCCEHYDKCKTEMLACEAFHFYAVTGRVVSPKMVSLPIDSKKKRRCEPYIDINVQPTRARYDRIFTADDKHGTDGRYNTTKRRKAAEADHLPDNL